MKSYFFRKDLKKKLYRLSPDRLKEINIERKRVREKKRGKKKREREGLWKRRDGNTIKMEEREKLGVDSNGNLFSKTI